MSNLGIVFGELAKGVGAGMAQNARNEYELANDNMKANRQLSLQDRLAQMQEERKVRAEERAKAKRSATIAETRTGLVDKARGAHPWGENPDAVIPDPTNADMARALMEKDPNAARDFAALAQMDTADRNRAEDVAYRDKRAEKGDAQADRQFDLQQQQFEIAKKEAASRLNLLTQQISTAELGNEKLAKINDAMDEAISADTPAKSAAADRKLLTLLGKTTKTEAQQENLNALVGLLKATNNTLADMSLSELDRKEASDLRSEIYSKLKAHFGDDDVIVGSKQIKPPGSKP